MEEVTLEQKKVLETINKLVADFGLDVTVNENNIIIPKPPKP